MKIELKETSIIRDDKKGNVNYADWLMHSLDHATRGGLTMEMVELVLSIKFKLHSSCVELDLTDRELLFIKACVEKMNSDAVWVIAHTDIVDFVKYIRAL